MAIKVLRTIWPLVDVAVLSYVCIGIIGSAAMQHLAAWPGLVFVFAVYSGVYWIVPKLDKWSWQHLPRKVPQS